MSSVALPAFGTGVGGFSVEECAQVMVNAITDYAGTRGGLERVMLVLFGAEAHEAFERAACEAWDE